MINLCSDKLFIPVPSSCIIYEERLWLARVKQWQSSQTIYNHCLQTARSQASYCSSLLFVKTSSTTNYEWEMSINVHSFKGKFTKCYIVELSNFSSVLPVLKVSITESFLYSLLWALHDCVIHFIRKVVQTIIVIFNVKYKLSDCFNFLKRKNLFISLHVYA